MRLIGSRFGTVLAHDTARAVVVKSQDVRVNELHTSDCHREYLGYRLGTRLGLAVPATRLGRSGQLGRVSVQHFVAGARQPTEHEQRALAATDAGIRLALLDALVANHDRSLPNMLLMGEQLLPIDFNCAFQPRREPFDMEVSLLLSSWFGIEGIVAHRRRLRPIVEREVERLCRLLDEPYLRAVADEVPDDFLPAGERDLLVAWLADRRIHLPCATDSWLASNTDPLNRLLDQGEHR